MDGYEVTCSVENRAATGIAEVVVHLRIHAGGDLVLNDAHSREATVFARQALAGNASMRLRFPHIVRLPLESFDTAADRGPGFAATVYWRDDDGKRWKRTGGGRAVTCRQRDYPTG
jgi:hypothetical protein